MSPDFEGAIERYGEAHDIRWPATAERELDEVPETVTVWRAAVAGLGGKADVETV